MKSKLIITELVSLGLVAVAAVTGCGSTTPSDTTGGAGVGGAGGSNSGAAVGSGGTAGSSVAMGTGGALGTGGASGTGGGPADVADAHEAGVSLEGGAEPSPDAPAIVSPDAASSDAGGPATGADADTTPCTEGTFRPGNTNVTIQHANANRDYILHVPASYTGKTRVPLLIDMHGSGQTASAQAGTSGWTRKADATGFILIYPNALNMRWNAGTCCSPSVEQKIDDVGFIRAVVEKTIKDGCIDRKRVYASGLSGGGLMSYRLACEAADIFAGVAPVSGATVFAPCKPSGAVSVVAFRGLNDPLVPYNGGMPLQWYFQGAKADFDQWSMLDQCTGAITMSHNVCQTKTQCAGGADVTLCSINGDHVLYGQAASGGAPVPDTAWEIFQRHSLP